MVTVVYWAFVPELAEPVGASDAARSRLFPIAEALSPEVDLAFDHPVVLSDAIEAAGL